MYFDRNQSIEQTHDLPDEELVLRSLQNPALYEIFVGRYQDVFLRTSLRVLKRTEESEDAVQDAFLKIYLNAGKFKKQPGIEFKSWAFKILMNCVFTRYRKAKKNMNDSEYLDEVLYMRDTKAEFDLTQKELRDEIESILNEMPEELSSLMREHYLDDRPYEEIAYSREMSIPALKMKLFRARKKFKDIMGQDSK